MTVLPTSSTVSSGFLRSPAVVSARSHQRFDRAAHQLGQLLAPLVLEGEVRAAHDVAAGAALRIQCGLGRKHATGFEIQ